MFFITLLADAILVIHFGIVSFVIVGLLAVLVGGLMRWQWVRNPWFRAAHLATIGVVAYESFAEIECPLTTWERDLRVYAKQIPENRQELATWDVENASFVASIIRSIMMFEADVGPMLQIGYYSFAALVVATLFLVPPRFRRQAPVAPPV